MENDKIIVVDDNGNEVEFEILFTFENDENGHKYVLYFDPNEEVPSAQAAIYDDEGGLFPVEDPEEWELIEEVFQAFTAEEDEEDSETEYCEEEGCN